MAARSFNIRLPPFTVSPNKGFRKEVSPLLLQYVLVDGVFKRPPPLRSIIDLVPVRSFRQDNDDIAEVGTGSVAGSSPGAAAIDTAISPPLPPLASSSYQQVPTSTVLVRPAPKTAVNLQSKHFPGGLVMKLDQIPLRFYSTMSHVECYYESWKKSDFPVKIYRLRYDDENVTQKAEFDRSGDKLGEGTFGEVFPISPKSSMVVKIVYKHAAGQENEQSAKHLMQAPGVSVDEALISMRLNHPNIVKIVRTFMLHAEETKQISVMHYMERMHMNATAFSRKSDFTKNLDVNGRVLEYDCLSALDYMHKHGFVHKDLKPQNILIRLLPKSSIAGPRRFYAKIADLGSVSNTANQVLSGTYTFLAPECVAPQIQTHASDMWALFATFFEIRTRTPLLAVFETASNRAQVQDILVPLVKDSAALLNHVYQMHAKFWGTGQNPENSNSILKEYGLSRTLLNNMTEPKFEELFSYHKRINSVKNWDASIAFLEIFKQVMRCEASARLTAAQVLEIEREYFSNIGIAPDLFVLNKDELPDAVKFAEYKSVWFAQRGEKGERDYFRNRTTIGAQPTPKGGVLLKIGPDELLPPGDVLHRLQKPKMLLTETALLAAGHNYFVFPWESNRIVLTTFIPIGGSDVIKKAKLFCVQVLERKGGPFHLPIIEYFMEMIGRHLLIHAIVEKSWRHAGAISHKTITSFNNLLGHFLAMSQTFSDKYIAGGSLYGGLWTDGDGRYRMNPFHYYYAALGRVGFATAIKGEADVPKTLKDQYIKFTPALIFSAIKDLSPPKEFLDIWEGPFSDSNTEWQDLINYYNEKVGELPVDDTPMSSKTVLSTKSPRVRLALFDTAI